MEKRKGRPPKPADQRLVPASTAIPIPAYDQICRMAQARHETMSETIRVLLMAQVAIIHIGK